MSLRAYLTLLRPWRTLVIATMYSGFVYLWLRTLFHAPARDSLLFTLAFFGPAVLGGMLLGPLHEVMHRSTFPMLPGARREFRRWHLRSLAAASLLFFIPTVCFAKTVPVAASYGLIIAGLALPLLNTRRRLWGSTRPQLPLFILCGVLAMALGRELITAACDAAPWVVLAGGLSFAALCFRSGFSSPNTRDRWRDPLLYCVQSTLPFVGSDILIHAQGQMRQFAQERNDKPSLDWNVTTVGTSLRGWCRAIHHARIGNMSRLSLFVRLDLTGAVFFPLFFVIAYAMSKLGGDSASSLTKFCHLLLDNGKTGGSTSVHPIVGTVLTMPPFFFFGIGMLVAMQSAAPSTRFPISRARLARCLFTAAIRRVAIISVAYLFGIGLSLFAASWIVGRPFELSALSKPLATAAIIPRPSRWASAPIFCAIPSCAISPVPPSPSAPSRPLPLSSCTSPPTCSARLGCSPAPQPPSSPCG